MTEEYALSDAAFTDSCRRLRDREGYEEYHQHLTVDLSHDEWRQVLVTIRWADGYALAARIWDQLKEQTGRPFG